MVLQMKGGRRLMRMLIGKPILVPLTASLYVPGTLADTDNVIVDVGTGFYVEKVHVCLTRVFFIAETVAEYERSYEILRGKSG